MRPWPEPGARKEEEAMKKLFALLMALTMTVQLVTPAWADAVEDGAEETTETVEVVQETRRPPRRRKSQKRRRPRRRRQRPGKK